MIPPSVKELGELLWRAALPVLTPVSSATPPSGCQLLIYYRLFGSCMGRHRDNYRHNSMLDVWCGDRNLEGLVEGNPMGGDINSQAVGSNVLIYTEGDADMTFALSFPADGHSGCKDYVIHPSCCISLGKGTLLVFSPVDDVFFCHEAFFLEDAQGTHRLAFVFRWLTQVRTFYACNNKHKLSSKLEVQSQECKRKKAATAASARRAACRIGAR